jgi:predicted NBD/HSP70 family sugar kinase/transcriptional regulator with XRE-family HTH domain
MTTPRRDVGPRSPGKVIEPAPVANELDDLLASELRDPQVEIAFNEAEARKEVVRALADLRKRAGLTQEQVAGRMGTTQSQVSEIEHARIDPRLSSLQRYARVLGRELDVRLRLDELPADLGGLAISQALRSVVDQSAANAVRTPHVNRSGLTDRTLSATISTLQSQGWLTEAGRRSSVHSRVRLNAQRAAVLGMSVRSDHVTGVLTNLRAHEVLKLVRRPLEDSAPATVVHVIGELCATLTRAAEEARLECLGLGVELAGHVEDGYGQAGVVRFAPDLATKEAPWHEVRLEDEIQQSSKLRTVVENDANALASYEYMLNGSPDGPLAVVLLSSDGEGVGCGVVSHGDVLHGAGGIAWEIGHLTVIPRGTECRCGKNGCVETVSSPAGVLRAIRAGVDRNVKSLAFASKLVASGEPAAVSAFLDGGRTLGDALATLSTLLRPARVAIYGPSELVAEETSLSAGLYMGGVRSVLGNAPFEPKINITSSEIAETDCALGAASVAVRQFMRYPLHWVTPVDNPEEGWTEPGHSLVRAAAILQQS